MKHAPWYLVLAALALAVWFGYTGQGARTEARRLRVVADSVEDHAVRVTVQALRLMAERDSALTAERAKARRVIARTDTVRVEAEAVLALPDATTDTLRLTIRSLLWSNQQVAEEFRLHLASDSAWTVRTDSTWQARVDAERDVSASLRDINRDTAQRLKTAQRGRVRQAVCMAAGAGVGAELGAALRQPASAALAATAGGVAGLVLCR